MSKLQTPRISVVVPVYNAELYLSKCLESILNQTFEDFELICVDDGSSDDSVAILTSYADIDNRVKIMRQPNQGVSTSRNNAIDISIGKYIFFVDSDDYIASQTLEFLYRVMEENDVDIACTNFCYHVDMLEGFKEILDYDKVNKMFFDDPLYKYFTERKMIYGMIWNKIYKADMVKSIKFIPDRLFEDEIFTAMVMEKCKNMVQVDFNSYCYFYNENSISRKKFNKRVLADFIKNAEFLCEYFADNKHIGIIKERKVKALLSTCYKRIKELDKNEHADLFKELKYGVKSMKDRGLITYGDFNIEGKLKLFRLLNLI